MEEKMITDEQANAVFRKRRRILVVALCVWGVVGMLRIPYFTSRWPELKNWSIITLGLLSIVIFGLYLWVYRCVLCGGGLKVDGKTCSKCGHVFEEPRRSP